MATTTRSLQLLEELDHGEGPAWRTESAQLQDEILTRLEELKADGALYDAMQLHEWLRELGKAAFEILGLPTRRDDRPQVRTGIPIEELYQAVRRDYIAKGKDITNLEGRWKLHLEPVFGKMTTSQVRAEEVFLYQSHRREQGAAPATINRESSILKRMYKLAIQSGRLRFGQLPYIGMLPEHENVRTGFLRDDQYEKLARATAEIGVWLRTLFELGYSYGWRKRELLGLRVSQVCPEEGTISLHAHQSKNRSGRLVFMTERVRELVLQCIAGKGPDDFVITRSTFEGGCVSLNDHGPSKSRFWRLKYRDASGKLVQKSSKVTDEQEARELLREILESVNRSGTGRRVQEFRKDWQAATRAAGVAGLLFHDLRRSASRNLIRAGVSEKVSMTITGHKTASVFKRYEIVSQEELIDASSKLQAAAAQRREKKAA